MENASLEKSERAISLVLRYGSLVSTLIMVLGLVMFHLTGGRAASFEPDGIKLRLLLGQLVQFSPVAIIELGVLLLLLTPIFRVVVAVVGFALERDPKYVLISLCVLSIVLFSIGYAVVS